MNNNSSNKNYKSIYEQSVSQTTRLDLDEEVYAAEVTSTRQLDDEEIKFTQIFDDRLYLTTFGGGVLKLENLTSLY